VNQAINLCYIFAFTKGIYILLSIVKEITILLRIVQMQIREIATVLEAKVLTPTLDVSREVNHAFSSDLMSDVLTRDYEDTILITGLSNMQSIRTAEMSDIGQVLIARDKEVSEEMILLAEENDIVLLKSEHSIFKISGILFEAGIKPVF
jgi:predicted transcriptional regulator